MFKSLDEGGHESALTKSTIKDIRSGFISKTKLPEEDFEVVVPKKSPLTSIKTRTGDDKKVEVILLDGKPVFIVMDQLVVPSLRLVHRFPMIYPVFRCDKGALKFIINGANVMCPGLTHPNASMDEVEKDMVVALYVEGKQHAVGVGITKMSTKEIREVNKGVAVELLHFLNDGFWKFAKN